MPHYDDSSANCLVFTFKEGMLSAIAHDLKIRVTDFEIDLDLDAGRLEASFDPTSLRVDCAMKSGSEDPGTLKAKDKKKIEKNIVSDVLHAGKYGAITFASDSIEERDGGLVITGDLTLHGTTRTLKIEADEREGAYVADVTLHQPDFGIKPYSAMMGTLKIKPDVSVRVEVPA